MYRCIQHDTLRQPLEPEDCFLACTNNNPVKSEDGDVFWPNLRPVSFGERDLVSMPIALLPPSMHRAGDKPVTVVVYAPANAAADAGLGLGVEEQLTAAEGFALPAAPEGWVPVFVLEGCVLKVTDKPVNAERLTSPQMSLRKPGLRVALAPLLEGAGRPPWWLVCGRWVGGWGRGGGGRC
jgi:hypothetical protein